MIAKALMIVLITEMLMIIIWKSEIYTRKRRTSQRETDLRLTYKRYRELYPHSNINYPEYKKLQARSAYKKAVSSMKIKRMVR